MGLDVDCYLLIGLPYDEVVISGQEVAEEVTKYNPDTGAPYNYVKYKNTFTVGKKVFHEKDEADGFLEDNELTIFENDEYSFVGVEIAEVEGDGRIANGFSEVDFNDLTDSFLEAVKLFEKIDVPERISVAVFARASC